MLRIIERFFVSWRFAAFATPLLVAFALLLAALLWVPPAESGLGAFAEEFRVWCFGADSAATGASAFMKFATFFEVLSLGALIALVWYRQIVDQWKAQKSAFVPFVSAAFACVAALGVGLWLVGGPAVDPTVFPEKELRTQFAAPSLELVDHEGTPVSLAALRGQVVVVTAVYATCGLSCPRILGQAKRVLASLSPEQQAQVRVLGITLDPENDTVENLAQMAKAQGVAAPAYHLLTGEPSRVEAALDAFGVTRSRNAETGLIDHANLFTLIDREGRVAYRFTLSDLQEQWMGQALAALLRESALQRTARNE